MDRKEFLSATIALCSLGVIPAGIFESCSKATNNGPTNVNFTVDLNASANASLNNVGGALVVSGVIIIRFSTTEFYAYSAYCTHEGCQVGYNATSARIICPCHGGQFNASTGSVLAGPPPSGLAKYIVTQNGNMLTITS